MTDLKLTTAWNSLVEGIVKAVAMELTVFEDKPEEILLSGRLTRVPRLYSSLVKRLRRYDIPVRKLEGYATKSKEAAQGASGIASGTVLDYIRWPGFNAEERINKKLRAMKMAH